MSCDAEDFRQYKDEQQARRKERLPIRVAEIMALTNEGYKVEKKTDYQFRIENVYDLYPIHNRWHHLPSGKRGGAENLADFIRMKFYMKK